MTAETGHHPPPDVLSAFAAGRLDGPSADAIESHLAGCPECSATLDALPADEFVGCLRDAYALTGDETTVPAALRDHPRYRVVGLLGKGGMGAVYRAEHTLMGRTVALKVIAPRLLERPGAAERFKHEVRAAARLVHRNIVTAYDAEQVGPLTVLVMECVDGRTLADVSRERGPLPMMDAASYVRQAAEGLAFAHAAGTVHRDIKPHNLMLANDGTVKILDFGLSRFVSAEPEAIEPSEDTATGGGDGLTDGGVLMGTLDYMAPEQTRDARQADARSDVYALGATLYKLLTGVAPFGGRGVGETLDAVRAGRFPPPRSLRADVPPVLEAVCLRAMAADPAERYPSAQAFADDLGRWLAGDAVTAFRESPLDRLRRGLRRHARLAAVLVVVGLALGLVWWQRDKAVAARKLTREALDAMVSGVTGDSLETQATLTPEQKAFLNSVLAYYEEFAAEPSEGRVGRERLAVATYRLALIRNRLGQRDESAILFGRAATLCGGLADDFPEVAAYRRDLARCHNSRGVALRELGRRTESEAAYRAALPIQMKLAADFPSESGYRHDAGLSEYNLGHLLSDMSRHADAEAAYRSALVHQTKLVADFPAEPRYRHALARSHNGLANLVGDLGRHAEAEAAYRAAIADQTRLVADFPAIAAYRHELARTYNNLGILVGDLNRPAEAEAAYRSALALDAKLAADAPGVPEYQQSLGLTNSNLGVQLADTGRGPEAEAFYRAAIAVQTRLTADFPGVPAYRSELARSHNNLGNLLGDLGRLPEAETAYRAALTFREALVAAAPKVAAYRQDLAGVHNNLGTLFGEQGWSLDAEAQFRAAVTLYHRLAEEFPKVPDHRRYLALAHNNLGNQLRRQGRLVDAEAAYRAALGLRTKLATDHTRVVGYRVQVSETVAALSGVLVATGRAVEAQGLAMRTLDGPDPPAAVIYNAACVHALASVDGPQAESTAAAAVGLLRRAFIAGYRDVPHMLRDADLAALRRRADYAALLWEIADGLP